MNFGFKDYCGSSFNRICRISRAKFPFTKMKKPITWLYEIVSSV